VLLSAVASLTPAIGPAEIRHIEGRRGLRIRARLAGTDLGRVADDVQAVLARHASDDPRVEALVSGQAREMGASLDSLLFAAMIAVFLIYVVMASSFESLHHPLLIMGTVPLALIGVSAACVVTGTPISASSWTMPRTIEVVRFRLSGRPNIEYAVADANAWPFPEGRFGCVTSITTLHHRPLAPTLRRGWGPPSGQAGLCWRSTSTGQGAMPTSSWGH